MSVVAAGVCRRETGKYCVKKSIFFKAVRLGEKVRLGRYAAHLIGGPAKSARLRVGEGRGRKRHSKSSAPNLGELSSESIGCRDFGNQQEDGLEDRNPVARKMEASARYGGDFRNSGASGTQKG